MKKSFLVLALFLLLCLAGCGSAANRETAGREEVFSETISESETGRSQADTFGGILEGQTYRQDFFGFFVTLDDSWVYQTEEERIAQNQRILDAAGDASARETIEKGLESGNLIIDMTASSEAEGAVLMVRLLPYGGLEDVGGQDLPEEALADRIRLSMEKDADQAGIREIVSRTEEIDFLGRQAFSVYLEGLLTAQADSQVPYFERGVLIKKDTGLALILCTGIVRGDGDWSLDLLNLFQPL